MGCNLFSRRRGRGRGSRKFFKPIRSLRGKRYLKSTAKSRQFGGNHCTTHYANKGGSGVGKTIEDTTEEAVDQGEKLGKKGARGVENLFSRAWNGVSGIASSVRGSVRRNTGLGGGSRRRRRGRKSRRRRRKGCGCK